MNSTHAASDSSSAKTPVVLIHGMWMTPRSWDSWVERYTRAGHEVLAPAWPGLEAEVESLNRDPRPLEGLGIAEIVDNYERIIRGLSAPPVLIGHSYGGAIVQMLLDRGLGRAGVALNSAQVKGVYTLPFSTLRSVGSMLLNPFNYGRALPMTRAQFHYAFTNSLTRAESDAVYDRLHVPGAGRAIFQGALANFVPGSAMKVNFRNDTRAPLLIVAGGRDQILPASIQRENVYRYRHSQAHTELRVYEDRTHYIAGQQGWEQVADESLAWALAHQKA